MCDWRFRSTDAETETRLTCRVERRTAAPLSLLRLGLALTGIVLLLFVVLSLTRF